MAISSTTRLKAALGRYTQSPGYEKAAQIEEIEVNSKAVKQLALIHEKLKENGTLTLVTEVTNDLLEPVSNDEFRSWKTWLASIFVTFGFTLREVFNECPLHYRSHFLEQFRSDQLRIKIITLILEKPHYKSI